jgi:hypothetical protein
LKKATVLQWISSTGMSGRVSKNKEWRILKDKLQVKKDKISFVIFWTYSQKWNLIMSEKRLNDCFLNPYKIVNSTFTVSIANTASKKTKKPVEFTIFHLVFWRAKNQHFFAAEGPMWHLRGSRPWKSRHHWRGLLIVFIFKRKMKRGMNRRTT